MLIGIIAQESGFSRDTIRYYEKFGLLRLPKKARRENNYKEYSPAILARLRAIRELKKIGYTLAEIQRVIAAYETGGLDCIIGKDQVLEKVRLLDAQISQLLTIKQRLSEAVADCPEHCKITAILDDTLAAANQEVIIYNRSSMKYQVNIPQLWIVLLEVSAGFHAVSLLHLEKTLL